MKKINLEAFKKDEVNLNHMVNVQGGSGHGSSTSLLCTFCIPTDSDSSWWYGDTDN